MPNYPAPVANPTVQHNNLITMLRLGISPTFPNAPDLNVDPDVLINYLKPPAGTHVQTAQGHKVS